MDLYIQVHARRHLPSAVLWISEDRLYVSALHMYVDAYVYDYVDLCWIYLLR